jgi:hypothetical protein
LENEPPWRTHYFIYAFDELSRTGVGRDRARYALAEVCGESVSDGGGAWHPIYRRDRKVLSDGFRIRTGHDHSSVIASAERE